MTVSLLISIIGYVLLITVDLGNVALTYFAIFMTTVGVSLAIFNCSSMKRRNTLLTYTFCLGLPDESHQQCLDCFQHTESECASVHKRHVDLHRQHCGLDIE